MTPDITPEAGEPAKKARASATRDERGRFRKGASPNAGGRPKRAKEIAPMIAEAVAAGHT
jgi:hypothetical protein